MSSIPETPSEPPFSVWRSRPFLLFIVIRACGGSASQMLAVALGYRMYQLTDSAASLGFIGLAQFLPALLLALPAGHAIDRYRRRTIIRMAHGINMTNAALLVATGLTDTNGVLVLYTSAIMTGTTRAFEMPANQALLSSLVPRTHLARAVAWSSSVMQTSILVAPALGGLLYEFGPVAAFGACLALWTCSFAAALMLPPGLQRIATEAPSLKSVFAGIHYIWRRQEILGAMSIDLFGVLLGGATALLPIFARDILHVSPFAFGMLRAAPAVGGLAVASILSRFPIRHHNGPVLFVAMAAFGLATCGFGLATSFPVAILMLILIGATDMVNVNIRMTLVQLRTPDEMRGRVSSVNSIFIGTSNQLGEFESGITAHYFGAVPSVLIGGLGTLAVVGLSLVVFPALRRVDRLEEPVAA